MSSDVDEGKRGTRYSVKVPECTDLGTIGRQSPHGGALRELTSRREAARGGWAEREQMCATKVTRVEVVC